MLGSETKFACSLLPANHNSIDNHCRNVYSRKLPTAARRMPYLRKTDLSAVVCNLIAVWPLHDSIMIRHQQDESRSIDPFVP